MSEEDLMRVREHVLEVLTHVRDEGAPSAAGWFGTKACDLHDRYLPALHRFAAGDAMSTDNLHMALRGMETAAVAASDQQLFIRSGEAARHALPLCSVGYRQVMRQPFTDLMRRQLATGKVAATGPASPRSDLVL
jgi:hypothetical protein